MPPGCTPGSAPVVEERARVGHDVRGRRDREESSRSTRAVRIGNILRARPSGHRPGAVVEVWQEHVVAITVESRSNLQHRRANADAVHVHEHRRPGRWRGGLPDVSGATPVAGADVNSSHRGLGGSAARLANTAARGRSPKKTPPCGRGRGCKNAAAALQSAIVTALVDR